MPTALIVGASRGLGRALVQELLGRGWSVTATVRQPDALADLATAALTVETLDIVDFPAIDDLRDRLAGQPLDMLFVNAGVSGDRDAPIGEIAAAAYAEVLLVNSLAPLHVIERLTDLVAADGTVAVMSSRLGSIAFNDVGGYETYRMSKAALNMGLRSIAARRADRRTWLAMHPGWVQTDLGGTQAPLTIDRSIPGVADALEARRGTGGIAFVDYRNEDLPW